MEKSTSRLKLFAVLVACMFAALTARLWFLQVLASASARTQIQQQSVRIVRTDAPRGDIVDDHGRPLVDNRLSLEVRIDKQHLGANPEEELLQLSTVLGIPVKSIRASLDDPRYYDYQPKPVAVDVPEVVADYLKEHQSDFPGVEVVEASVRDYPQGTMAAHILGWVGQISADELKSPAFAGYGPNDLVGKAGLEVQYEKYLRGKKGYEKFLLNAQQQEIRAIGTQAATSGDDLVLSIDLQAQRIAETALAQGIANARKIFDTSQTPPAYLKANSGAVIVMDPTTGAIKALASWPTYDPSWFVQGLSKQQSAYLFTDPSAPTLNRATQLTFAPGSTFKPFVALSALHSGIATLGGSYDCPATYVYPGDTTTIFHNWSSTSLGALSLAESLKVSCDTVFYQFGADFYNRYASNQLGVHALDLQKNLAQFGFGSPTGIDLPSEAQGLIPTPKWKARFARQNPKLFNPGEQGWLPGDDIQMAIGQGYVTVTPLQLATAFAAIANGGKMCRPHLVDHIEDPSGHVVKRIGGHCTRSLPYSQAEIDYIRSALATVTEPGGTAGLAFAGFPLSQLPVAGKTGTAQRPPFQDTSWFAAMAPAGSPQYLVVAMVEQGGHGSTSAAPIVRQVIEGLFGITGNGPSNGGVSD